MRVTALTSLSNLCVAAVRRPEQATTFVKQHRRPPGRVFGIANLLQLFNRPQPITCYTHPNLSNGRLRRTASLPAGVGST